MDRASGIGIREAALAGLTGLAVLACAQVQAPPGGPPDFTAPGLVSVSPDSGSAVSGFDDDVEFTFTETISEASGGGLDRLFEISPRPDRVRVSWHRSRIGVKPRGGWSENVVYHVTMLSGIQDLRNNTLESQRTVVFSTGDSLPNGRLSGTVINWHEHRIARNGLIEAVLLPDSLVYVSRVDSNGVYDFGPLPTGRYALFGVVDDNNNGRKDRRELYDSIMVQLDSVASSNLWAHANDTVPPRIANASGLDSTALVIPFTIPLLPGTEDSIAVQVFALPDTIPVPVRLVQTRAVFDSVRSARQETLRDSIAQAVADSLAALPDSLRPEPVAPPAADTAVAEPDSTPPPPAVLDERPRLTSEIVASLDTVFGPGSRFLVVADVTSVAGVSGEARGVVVIPERPARATADTTGLPVDSLPVPLDSIAPDSLPADSSAADPDQPR